MKIIYRVYEIDHKNTEWYENGKTLLDQQVILVESREQFKDLMRDMYGENVSFRQSKNSKDGDIIITIISEDAWDAEDYIVVHEHTCACCGKVFKANNKILKTSHNFEYKLNHISNELWKEHEEEIKNQVFCSIACKDKQLEKYTNKFMELVNENDLVPDYWIDRNSSFVESCAGGYIYKITKKSTGEEYVGQSNAVPIFRWGQHLKTERFKLSEITDYKFEVLEIVINSNDLTNREAYYINKCKNEIGDKCLNKIIPHYDSKVKLW